MPLEDCQYPRRKAVRWEWIVAAPVVALLTVFVWQFVDLLHAEVLLHRAASAAAKEAVLPKATSESITAAAHRTLRKSHLAQIADPPIITINGQPILLYPLDLLQSGDRVEVTLGAYATDVAPDMLRSLGLSLSGRKLRVAASFIKP